MLQAHVYYGFGYMANTTLLSKGKLDTLDPYNLFINHYNVSDYTVYGLP